MIVLDTCAWLWWLHDPGHLTERARQRLEQESADGRLVVSAISVWEVALKQSLGKLELPMALDTWYQKAQAYPRTTIEAISPHDLIESTRLPGNLHRDPADRIVVTVARRYGVPLVTSDRRLRSYRHVRTLW